MNNVTIRMIGADGESAHFKAVVSDAKGRVEEYVVSVGRGFWRTVTRGRFSPAELVSRSVRFLSHEMPKGVKLVRQFELSEIAGLFPDFATRVRMG